MSRGIYTRPRAALDIEHYTVFLAEESFEVASRFYDAVFATIDAIAGHPEAGRRREFGTPSLAGIWSRRVKGFRNHIVFYRIPERGPLQVLRVLHGAMDLEAVLEGEAE